MPEAPAAVREALVWAVRGSVSQRLLEAARGAAGAGEEGADALYAAAGRLLAARPYRGSAHPEAVRAALLSDEALPQGTDFAGVVHLVAAFGLGAEEVGADALAEAFAACGMFGLAAEDWAQMLGAAERGEGPPVDWGLLQQHADGLEQVRQASDEKLVRARTVLTGLRGFYGLYMLHGMLLPDIPGLAALRARIDGRGLGPYLDHVISVSPTPGSSPRASWPVSVRSWTSCTRRSWSSSRPTRPSSASPATRPAWSASARPGSARCAS